MQIKQIKQLFGNISQQIIYTCIYVHNQKYTPLCQTVITFIEYFITNITQKCTYTFTYQHSIIALARSTRQATANNNNDNVCMPSWWYNMQYKINKDLARNRICCVFLTRYTTTDIVYMTISVVFRKRGREIMMTWSNGSIFRVTGPLCGEFTGHRWVPLTESCDADLLCFLWAMPE